MNDTDTTQTPADLATRYVEQFLHCESSDPITDDYVWINFKQLPAGFSLETDELAKYNAGIAQIEKTSRFELSIALERIE